MSSTNPSSGGKSSELHKDVGNGHLVSANGKAASRDDEADWAEEDSDDIMSDDEEDSDENRTEADGLNADSGTSPLDAEGQIFDTYHRLPSRRLDLVGDYAGNELFLIEGDSLLLRCFDDPLLDFSTGLQLLHATYNVEHFLQNLAQRKCNFHIVFFESNKSLGIPPTAAREDYSKYLLARAAIIRHLQVNLKSTHPAIQVKVFTSWDSSDFANYLTTTSPYFLMLHDGAQMPDRRMHNEVQEPSTRSPQALQLRHMILSFIDRGFNVALVNGLEWRDTKVMTAVLELRSNIMVPAATLSNGIDSQDEQEQVAPELLDRVKALPSNLSERQVLGLATVAKIISNPPEGITDSSWQHLCASFLQHQAMLAHLPLSERRLATVDKIEGVDIFLQHISAMATSIIANEQWAQICGDRACDVADFVDGRLFLQVSASVAGLDSKAEETLQDLVSAVQTISLADVELPSPSKATERDTHATDDDASRTLVLPFSNPVFDKHLESIRLDVDNQAAGTKTSASRKVFQELSHWHNAKKPLAPKKANTAVTAKDAFWAAKRNQWFMAEMRTYSASLTNSIGKSLEPESIIVGSQKTSKSAAKSDHGSKHEADDTDSASSASKGKGGGKKGSKTAQLNVQKMQRKQAIQVDSAKKNEIANEKHFSAWKTACAGFESDNDPKKRFNKAMKYLAGLKKDTSKVIGAEVQLYMLNCLLSYWLEACKQKMQTSRVQVTALIWSNTNSIARQPQLPRSIISSLELTVKTLRLPPIQVPFDEASKDRKLAFTFALPSRIPDLSVGLNHKDFLLHHCGPYLERTFDSAPDDRVDFQPDGWQRKVLDAIDAQQSVFVVAPTSAGKTFISFYAMRKVLEADDDGILVYVAPTKALVNQIAAEIQARYNKNFKYPGRSVWAIHTRDYRINNPTGCQVLVTVPHILQIMLMAPSNANSWSSKVKRIIFDEIHSIGQAEDGVVWEQLLLLAPCPIVALSATVGNPSEFSDWLASTQKAIGVDLVNVQHPYRWSDLRKFFYVPPAKFAFGGLSENPIFGSLGLDGLPGFNYIHPVAALVDKSRGIPDDLALEARDCLLLWKAMVEVATPNHEVPAYLHPQKSIPSEPRKLDILKWEAALKSLLQKWLADPDSPFDDLLQKLQQSFVDDSRQALQSTSPAGAKASTSRSLEGESDDLLKTTLPLLCHLHEQDALPAILFNYDRHMCETVARAVLDELVESETKLHKSGPHWEAQLAKWEKYKEMKEKSNAKSSKLTAKKTSKKGKGDDADEGEDKTSKLEQTRDVAGQDASYWDAFNPDAPMDGFTFANSTKLEQSELDRYVRQLGRRNIQQWLVDGLRRGIGVHHAGMNRKYRQVVEMLFRQGFLRVVIATGTLALGINMPCKTVVFSGDSVYLTALNYRQGAGRAGRRGFDQLGNVVFQGISRHKVCRLISSRLPDLNGHFPITTSLVVRMFNLLHESKNSKYAVNAINAMLSQPRLFLGGPSFKDQTMHHLRFSIEYLRRQHLLGMDGAPLNFAGLVSHLYFTENSAFAFHALLKEGYFHELCSEIDSKEKSTVQTLMLVMAHLFSRIHCRQSDAEYRENVVKPSSSIVFLPHLPAKAAAILREHNQQTLSVFKAYVETFVRQHIKEDDTTLPFTRTSVGTQDTSDAATVSSLPPARIRSPFAALSGAGDDFSTVHDLCTTVRSGVFLEEAVIPHVSVYPEETESPLNAYLLDFLKHGDVMTLERANGIRRSDIWFLLNDFSLVLATIITSLTNFLKIKETSDMDMLDIQGALDAFDEAEEDKVAEGEASSSQDDASVATSAADSAVSGLPAKIEKVEIKRKKKVKDSWEDEADEEDANDRNNFDSRTASGENSDTEDLHSWDKEDAENTGLRKVLKAFVALHKDFNEKFRAMWA